MTPRNSLDQESRMLKNSSLVIGTFASLINQGIIIISERVQHVSVERHLFVKLLEESIRQIDFDEEWYISTYHDVADAIKMGDIANARSHYVQFGYYEHRLPYRITADNDWYLDVYPDVREAVTKGLFSSAQLHFMEVGYREGRFPYPNFNLRRMNEVE